MKNLLFSLFFLAPLAATEMHTEVAAAAEKFLVTLDSNQKAKASLPFDAAARTHFHYTPHDRAGLPLKEMTAAQRTAAMALLGAVLSEKGVLKASQIILLEGVLAEIENNPTFRDPEAYTIAIFGIPGHPQGWGWRYEGHHLSLNLTLVQGQPISVTPTFLGSNPAEVRTGKHRGLRVLAAEEDLARSLVVALVAAGKTAVIFGSEPPAEIISGENRTATALTPVGLSAAEMTGLQRQALLELISEYTGRYRPEIAASDLQKIQTAGIEKIRLGWAGSTQRGKPYYYRIQGPTFLIEAANVQNNANHLHTTWRDFTGDFGRDLLQQHLNSEH